MRRISLGVTLLLLVPSITQADYNYVPLRYRVQYSPYAFGYHNNGLVPGGIQYSPYAFKPSVSGLIFEGVRYIPYAFTYKSSGLVLDYYWYPIPNAAYGPPCPAQQAYSGYACVPSSSTHTVSCRVQPCDRSRDTAPPTTVNGPAASAESEDAITIIRQYLRERGFSDVGINRILRIDNKLVSADFAVGGRNLLIKYWNPTQTEPADAKTEPQPSPSKSSASRTIEKYRKDWEAFAGKYQQEGGAIHVVSASGRMDIIVALDACDKLSPGGTEPSPEPKYVKQ